MPSTSTTSSNPSFVGEDAEQWVKDHKRPKNGRTDFLILVAHFTGEGNNNRRIGDAECHEKTLHYKDERAIANQTFLAKTKYMFNILVEVGESKNQQKFDSCWMESNAQTYSQSCKLLERA
jgi:hypothetical protein